MVDTIRPAEPKTILTEERTEPSDEYEKPIIRDKNPRDTLEQGIGGTRRELSGAFRMPPCAEGISGITEAKEETDDDLITELLEIEQGSLTVAPERAPNERAAQIVTSLCHRYLGSDPFYIKHAIQYLPAATLKELLAYEDIIKGGIGRKAANLVLVQAVLTHPLDQETEKQLLKIYPNLRFLFRKTGWEKSFERNERSVPIGMQVCDDILKANEELQTLIDESIGKYKNGQLVSPDDHEIIATMWNPEFPELKTPDTVTTMTSDSNMKIPNTDSPFQLTIPDHVRRILLRVYKKFAPTDGKKVVIILRSSSRLEDGGLEENASFGGCYESVPVVLTGDEKIDFEHFTQAYLKVLESMFAETPLKYRRDHGLLEEKESMAVLVQRMNGGNMRRKQKEKGKYVESDVFFSYLAGVATSFAENPAGQDPEQGGMQLVLGLGPAIADYGLGHYVPLAKPNMTFDGGDTDVQAKVCVINLDTGRTEWAHPSELPAEKLGEIMTSVPGDPDRKVCNFKNACSMQSDLPLIVAYMVQLLKIRLGQNAQVEFTAEPGQAFNSWKISMVQWRPQHVPESAHPSRMPQEIPQKNILGKSPSLKTVLTLSGVTDILFVDPNLFDPTKIDHSVINAIPHCLEGLNRHLEENPDRKCCLIVGRRLGSENTPGEGVSYATNSGIPATPNQYSRVKGVIELCRSDPSRGSHARDRLKDLGIVVAAAQPDDLNLNFLRQCSHSPKFPLMKSFIPSNLFTAQTIETAANFVKMIDVEDAWKLLYSKNGDGGENPCDGKNPGDERHVLHIATDHREQTDVGPGMIYLYFAQKGENIPIKIS